MSKLSGNPTLRKTELKRTPCAWAAFCDRICLGDRIDSQGAVTCKPGHCFRYAAERLWTQKHPGTELDLP